MKRIRMSVAVFFGVVLCLAALGCVGRVTVSYPTNLETYGKVGDQIGAFTGWKVGPAGVPVGALDATFDSITVTVGDEPADVVDVVHVTSTRYTGTEFTAVVFNIPSVSRTRHSIKVFHNGTPITEAGDLYVVVTPK